MRTTRRLQAALAVAAAQLGLLNPSAEAANLTWTGTGADALWGTGDNWQGAPPANGDFLAFSGAATATTNDLANLRVAGMRFETGGFRLRGNPLTLTPSGSGLFTNLVGQNVLDLPLTLTAAPAFWSVAPGTELVLAGALTNTSAGGVSAGWLVLTNGGTVRITGSGKSARGLDLFTGTVVVDGGLVDATNDGVRMKPPTDGSTTVILTNNGTLRIGGGGNYRLGNSSTGVGPAGGAGGVSTTVLDSGTLELYGAASSIFVGDNAAGAVGVFVQNGGLVRGSAGSGNTLVLGNGAGTDGTYRLNGGTLQIGQVRQANAAAASTVFHFNGGVLKASANRADFFQGLTGALVGNDGAVIDTTNFTVSVAQSLQANGTGGLTKRGAGTLVLSGSGAWSGATTVAEGRLALTSPDLLAGGGPLVVADGSSLAISNAYSSLNASSVSLGTVGALSLDFDFPTGNATVPVIVSGPLRVDGTVTVNVSGQAVVPGAIPLLQFGSIAGTGGFRLGTLPAGVPATLVTNGNTLVLQVDRVVNTLAWSGAIDGEWNTTTANWLDLNNGSAAIAYQQIGGFGDRVSFDDSAATASVSLATTLTPAGVSFANAGLAYILSGPGRISGAGSVSFDGSGEVTLATANDYTGGTALNAGALRLGTSQAVGTGPLVLNGGVLSSDGSAARALANPVVLNAGFGVELGALDRPGMLEFQGLFDLGGGNGRTLAVQSDVKVSGTQTNGGFTAKTGPGRLLITGRGRQPSLVDHRQGDVVVDGGEFENREGWRVQNFLGEAPVRLVVTNGGVFRMRSDTGNLRLGLAGGSDLSDNILDLSGTADLGPANAATANSSLLLGQSGANNIANLLANGLLVCRSIVGQASLNTELRLNGGTLRPIADNDGFILGLTNAWIHDGGVTVDTTNFNIAIPQPLVAAGNGGLTKTGSGTLALSGANTYLGLTRVAEGRLALHPSHRALAGGIHVASNAVLALVSPAPGEFVGVSGATNAHGSVLEARFTGVSDNPAAPAGYLTNLVLEGTVKISVTGASLKPGQFPLFGYGTLAGEGGLAVGSLPQGVVATVVTNSAAKTIDLVVHGVSSLVWTGLNSDLWDVASTNWTVSGAPARYVQGDDVRFDDSAVATSVQLATAVTPAGVTVSNQSRAFAFTGGSGISGATGLTKDGAASLSIATANSFLGTVTVKAGSLLTDNAAALGSTNGPTVVLSGATLDVRAQNLGREALVLAGAGVDGRGALINSGADQNNAALDVSLAGDTTVRAEGMLGIRMPGEDDPGFQGHGYKLTKVGPGAFNLNGGQGNLAGTRLWETDLGDIDIVEGTLSFERRITLGRNDRTITVRPGGRLHFFALNPSVVPLQTKPIHLMNGTLAASGASLADVTTLGSPITVDAGTNFVTATTATLVLQGAIGGPGTVRYAGVIQLDAVNPYTGATLVQSGTLQLGAAASIAASPRVVVAAGATLDGAALGVWNVVASQSLEGDGTVNGSVAVAGTVSPGAGIGTLTVNGDATVSGTSVFEVTRTGGVAHDALAVNGALNLGGVLQVRLVGETALEVGDTFTLFTAALPSTVSTLDLPAAYGWDTSRLTVDGSIRVTGTAIQPRIGTIRVSGGDLVLEGNGGSAGTSYRVLGSTNMALPLVNWVPVQTNTFSAGGAFSVTLPWSPEPPQRFFLITQP